jgi:hypothetical protein
LRAATTLKRKAKSSTKRMSRTSTWRMTLLLGLRDSRQWLAAVDAPVVRVVRAATTIVAVVVGAVLVLAVVAGAVRGRPKLGRKC